MRKALLACPLVLALLPAPASATCRCVCVQGQVRAVCQPTDLMIPICQQICPEDVRPERVTRPLAGGKPVNEPVRPANPSPREVQPFDEDFESNPNGQALGVPSSLSGSAGSSLSGGSGGSGAGSGGR